MTGRVDRLAAALETRFDDVGAIGRGGMAYVFEGTAPGDGRRVAIKVLDPRVSVRIARERFIREIELSSKLHHPHIVPILDSGEIGEVPFYVMPLLQGGTLRDRLEREGCLPVEAATHIAGSVAGALSYAHGEGIMHRDIKPENILCEQDDVLVADFGFARAFRAASDDRLTRAGDVLGTPQYMSPEQAMGKYDVGSSCDIYGLGCVFYEMLTGEPPFTGSSPDSVIVRRLKDIVPCASDERGGIPPAIDALIVDALAWNPRERLSSAAEFLERLSSVDLAE